MAGVIKLGQILKGKLSVYTITKEIYNGVWLAKNKINQTVVVKGIKNNWCTQNERDILKHFQAFAPLRPLIDDLQDVESEVQPIVLKHFDKTLYHASIDQRLTVPEVKYVAKRVLQALAVLHSSGYIYTDLKPHNILANRGSGSQGFSEVVLADFGDTLHKDSEYPKDGGGRGGSPIFRSPELAFKLPFGTASDIWSFGATLISLLIGRNWHIFNPDCDTEDPEFLMQINMKHVQWFGEYPVSFGDVADKDALMEMLEVLRRMPRKNQTPFFNVAEKDIKKEDKEFILKIMKMDPDKRPTAEQLLRDEWFEGM